MDVIIWIWIAVIVIIIGLMIWYLTKGETKISEEGRVQEGETPKEAAKREVVEELGVFPKNIIDLEYEIKVLIKSDKELSLEHAFLIEVPSNKNIKYLFIS